jgi:hypothetical protein
LTRVLFREIAVQRRPQANLVDVDAGIFAHEFRRNLPAAHLRRFTNVNVAADGVMFRNFRIYPENMVSPAHKRMFTARYLLSKYRSKRLPLARSETYVLAFEYWSDSYFHWITDVLPRLLAIEHQLPELVLLLQENFTTDFVRFTIEVLRPCRSGRGWQRA